MNSSSFDKGLYNELKINITLHKSLLNLTKENINDISDSILKQSEIIGSKSGIYLLCESIIDIASFYSKNIELLVNIFTNLQNSKTKDPNFLHKLPQYIVKCIHTRENLRMSAVYFLRQLFLQKSVSYNLIINEINKLPPFISTLKFEEDTTYEIDDEELSFEENEPIQGLLTKKLTPFTQANNKKMFVLMMFYPEIKERTPDFDMNSFLGVSKEKYVFEPEVFHEKMNDGYNSDFLATAIRNDDIDTFQSYITKCSDSNVINQKITNHLTFERYQILLSQPTLIQYAAFFNSIKIFKYLLLNNAVTLKYEDEPYAIVHYAVSGGSIETIHLIEQNKLFPMVSAIPIAIKSYENEIFRFLLDNHFPNSNLDFDYMDIEEFRKREKKEKNIEINSQKHIDNFCFHLCNEIDYDYFYKNYGGFFYLISYDEKETNNDDNDKFKYFNFDIVFKAIVESNNLLALFILFDIGMNINARDQISKRTLLHWAVQKGKIFLVKLLLSNKFIDPLLKDEFGESPLVYSLKYGKTEIFFEFMKHKMIVDSLNLNDYLLLANYADKCGLEKVTEFLLKTSEFDLMIYLKSNDFQSYCNIINYVPFVYLLDQIEPVLTKTFLNNNYQLFVIFGYRLLKENSLTIKCDFYSVPDENQKKYTVIDVFSDYFCDCQFDSIYNVFQHFANDYQNCIWSNRLTMDKCGNSHLFNNFRFQFHNVDKQEKPYAKISFDHPFLHKK